VTKNAQGVTPTTSFALAGSNFTFSRAEEGPQDFFLRAFFAGEEERMWKGAGD
jgi:hypothetical protein